MFRYLPLLLVAVIGCSQDAMEPIAATVAYNVDASRISVSGVSSGAYMAGQLHLAHSSVPRSSRAALTTARWVSFPVDSGRA